MVMMMMHHNNNNNVIHQFGLINNSFRNNPMRKSFRMIGDTMFEVESKYELEDEIGRGSYGVVCSSVNTETDEKVAIKKIRVRADSKEALKALREVRILRHVRHQNVIGLKDVMIPSTNCRDVYLVFELMDSDLGSVIRSSSPLPNYLVKYFMMQLLNGLQYLHTAKIIHRDLKPGNLLVNAKHELKICDFGLATTTGGSSQIQLATENIGTRGYKAPELLLKCLTYGPSIDIWSVGCIFAELLKGKRLFAANDRPGQLIKIINILGTQNDSNLGFITRCDEEAYRVVISQPYTPGIDFKVLFPNADPMGLDLLNKMLQFDPNKRITVEKALQHPYIRSMYNHRKSQPVPSPCHVDVEASVGGCKIRKLIRDEMLLYRHSQKLLRDGLSIILRDFTH